MAIPSSLQHYIHEPLIKMGRWALLPADTETWMTEETSAAFEMLFGLPKGILNICTLDDGFMQNYVPRAYAERLFQHVKEKTFHEPTWLSDRLQTFYAERATASKEAQTSVDLSSLTHEELAQIYRRNRSWVHKLSAYDQFGWITERFWEPLLQERLRQAGIEPTHPDFHRILFALSKPEEPSTTIKERLAFLVAAQATMEGKTSLEEQVKHLAQAFGWMPVFTFGTPWTDAYYSKQLQREIPRDASTRQRTIKELQSYQQTREQERRTILKQLGWQEEDAQLFMDFSLTLDTRNEAEFFVSFAGFHLLSLYEEIAHRLQISVHELRQLFEAEIIASLEGTLDPKKCLAKKQGIVAWGFDPDVCERVNLTGSEARELFQAVEKNAAQSDQSNQSKGGACASPGNARGQARILHTPQDNDRVNEGDVLITVATTVDYLPAMQRASAIVTEVGGLTCHAAVVSRELNIPCIVSYPNAMTKFKDGQWLDIDADKVLITPRTL